jgi:RNA polymerase sigma-70 factor (ECF subfamily)
MNGIAFDLQTRPESRSPAKRTRSVTSPPDPAAVLRARDFNRDIQSIAEVADREAFARLYEYFAPRVTSYLTRLGAPPNVAEELVQETMLSVWRKAASFDPSRAGASTWIFTIARNLRIDYLRRDRSPADLLPDPSEEPDETPTMESTMITAQRDDRLREAMGSLSREQAEIVRLVYFQDRPHSEISRILGLPLGTVKSRVRLALGRLRSLLEDLK